ncbi:protein prenylyltransferase [Trametes versicolor FP-101664 SS1]|uniref:protein prenylyltransferase n=1 Tax=Trametes versicolor (strain FP-101664) TaxID=717944 RepID=UPI00046224A8|nr:protein prenylyltransferase [Trametes versicolor FP-101664 SS1]EIW54501.1 protein prenylyltransferase [Trametes versicolor FP-101664 SS1]
MSALTLKLGRILASPPISIELLPGDGSEWLAEGMPEESNPHAPFLFIEGNLDLPGTGDMADILHSSSVLLLVNPAHQSALNARKRLVKHGALDATQELRFVSALLTLHEGAKQSVLWHHRRWILRRISSTAGSPSCGTTSCSSDIPSSLTWDGEDSLRGLVLDADTWSVEFAAVDRACETYPRNYHAWAHRYLCAEALSTALRGDAGPALMEAWQLEKDRIRQWIERHVSDYSAMQYACRLEDLELGRFAGEQPITAASGDHTREIPSEEKETLVEHAWALVRAYPSHESLWLYLRGALRPPSNLAALHLDSATSDRVRNGARALAERFLSDGSADRGASVLPGEHALVGRHAARFLAWLLWQEGKLKMHRDVAREIVAVGNGELSQGEALIVYLKAACSV